MSRLKAIFPEDWQYILDTYKGFLCSIGAETADDEFLFGIKGNSNRSGLRWKMSRPVSHCHTGDRIFDVIHAPSHSSDSSCLFCEEDGVLFAGDTPVIIQSGGGNYEDGFVRTLEKLCRRNVRSIYFGHGVPLIDNCNEKIRFSLNNIRESRKVL